MLWFPEGVDCFHYFDGFVEGNNHSFVVFKFVRGELSTFAVFEVFLGGLVAADVEVPDGFGHAVPVLSVVDVDAIVAVGEFFNRVGTALGEGGDTLAHGRVSQEM